MIVDMLTHMDLPNTSSETNASVASTIGTVMFLTLLLVAVCTLSGIWQRGIPFWFVYVANAVNRLVQDIRMHVANIGQNAVIFLNAPTDTRRVQRHRHRNMPMAVAPRAAR